MLHDLLFLVMGVSLGLSLANLIYFYVGPKR